MEMIIRSISEITFWNFWLHKNYKWIYSPAYFNFYRAIVAVHTCNHFSDRHYQNAQIFRIRDDPSFPFPSFSGYFSKKIFKCILDISSCLYIVCSWWNNVPFVSRHLYLMYRFLLLCHNKRSSYELDIIIKEPSTYIFTEYFSCSRFSYTLDRDIKQNFSFQPNWKITSLQLYDYVCTLIWKDLSIITKLFVSAFVKCHHTLEWVFEAGN